MTKEQLKKKIHDVLSKGFFDDPEDAVGISDGPGDSVSLFVVSRKFDGRRLKEKNDLIWTQLTDRLGTDEWSRVSLSIGAGPEEIRKHSQPDEEFGEIMEHLQPEQDIEKIRKHLHGSADPCARISESVQSEHSGRSRLPVS